MADDFEARIDAQLLRTGEPRALATPSPSSSLSGQPITWALFHVDADGKRSMADWRLFPSKEAAVAGIGQQPECFRSETVAIGLCVEDTPVSNKRAQFLLEDCASYIDALHQKHKTPSLDIGIDTSTVRAAAASLAPSPAPRLDG